MAYSKFGQKAMSVAKIGVKGIHTGSKFGSKYGVPAASLASIALMGAAPEIALPLAAGAAYAKPILNNIEKISR